MSHAVGGPSRADPLARSCFQLILSTALINVASSDRSDDRHVAHIKCKWIRTLTKQPVSLSARDQRRSVVNLSVCFLRFLSQMLSSHTSVWGSVSALRGKSTLSWCLSDSADECRWGQAGKKMDKSGQSRTYLPLYPLWTAFMKL